ncbi:hypothetical protein HPB48_019087 [Haemaphysalis longicornis]|uniref:Uncharacterized protein n=1 Tax=Haemaphysalis longicornis TaxID=44386 RepID=A0A9J6G6A7_HAELO|nr:hypothetical protein HPB48_019087 [Haemaphysalis longicornis]
MTEPRGAPGAAAGRSNDASPERTVVAQTPNMSRQVIGTAVRMVTVVEGEPITALEHDGTVGWLPCHRRKFGQALQQFQRDATSPHPLSTTVNDTATFNKGKTPQGQRRPGFRTSKRPRPRLPRGDIKVVIRPREGMNVARVSDATLRDRVLQAAGLEPAEATEDLLRVNHEQNILVPPASAASAGDTSVPAERRPHSKSKKRGPRHGSTVQQDRQSIRRTPDGTSQVSWEATASLKGSSQGHTHQDPSQTSTGIAHAELASTRATLDQVLAENRQLKAKIAQLKRSTTTTSTPATTPTVQVTHSSGLTPSPPKRRAEDNTSRQQPIVHNDLQLLESKLEKKFDERFDKLANMVTTLAGALAKFKETIEKKVTSLEYSLTRVPHSSPGPTRPPPYARTHAVKATTILSNETEQNTARNDNKTQ